MRTCRASTALHLLLMIALMAVLGAPSAAADKPAVGESSTPPTVRAPAKKVAADAKKPAEAPAGGEGDTEALAKASQNPVADMISLPFQGNAYFGSGPADKTTATLNIQPVLPQSIGNWNIIHRAIMPIQYVPLSALPPSAGRPPEIGLGDINYTAFLSPAAPGKLIWGAAWDASSPSGSSR